MGGSYRKPACLTATVEPPVTAGQSCSALEEGLLVSDPIKVAVLGFWHVHAAEYAAHVHQHPNTKLVAVWDDDPARGRAAADAVDAVFVGDLDTLLARDDIDAVIAAAATTAHRAIMLRAAILGRREHHAEPGTVAVAD